MASVSAEVVLATSSDERFEASNAVDNKKHSFWLTTGGYPQELVIGFHGNACSVSKIQTTSNGIRKLRIEYTQERMPVKFSTLLECEIPSKHQGYQVEQFQLTAEKGKNIRFLKLVILAGYEQFSCVNEIAVEGQEHEEE